MANPFLTSATGNGAQTDFVMGFTMDSNLAYIDVTCTLNGTKITNFTKIDTQTIRFVAPIPSGALVFERFTPGGRKFTFTPGTRVIASQVGQEFDRQSADSLEAGQFSWRNYYTAKANAGAYVAIDSLGEHEVLTTVAPTAIFTSWGAPGAIGNVTPNTGVFTNLSASGTTTLQSTTLANGFLASSTSVACQFNGPVVFSSSQAQKDDTALGLGLNPFQNNFRNLIINGDFRFWQRQNSTTPAVVNPTDGAHLADRWRAFNTGTVATITYSRQLHTLGQVLVPGNPKYFLRAVQTVAPGTLNGFLQRIEDVTRTAGQLVNVRLNGARFDTSRALAYTVTQVFGTGGAPSGNVTVATGTIPMSSTFTGYNLSFTPPSISGKTLGTTEFTSYLEIRFEFPLTASFTFECSDIQCEQIQTAGEYTRFERRSDQVEWSLIARYVRPVSIEINAYNTAGATVLSGISLSPPMRAIPIRELDVASGSIGNVASSSPSGLSVAFPGIFNSGVGCVEIRQTAICTATGSIFIIGYQFIASAEL